MRLISGVEPVPAMLRGAVIAIGNFDGVHRGHQQLLAEARRAAEARGVPWGVVTFEPHPRSFFKPAVPVFRLTPADLKARIIAALGASFMVVLAFDRTLADLEPDDFIRTHLVHRLAVSHVVMGYDFHFGRGRRGSPATMAQAGASLGFGTTIVDQVSDEGDAHSPFSSSAIRQALHHGKLRDAALDLGYNWIVMGDVVKGDQRGRTIGFPTLNIILSPGADPFRGIYTVRVRDAHIKGAIAWAGAGYFGDRPTFDTGRTFLEVYLIGFSGDLYGRTMLVEMVDLIRPDRRFDSLVALTAQMRDDCDEALRRLDDREAEAPLTEFPLFRRQQNGEL